MKRILAALASLILLSSAPAEDVKYQSLNHTDDYINARFLGNFMEDHYDITILIGEETDIIETEGFILGEKPSGRSPFLNLLAQPNYYDDIKLIDDCLSFYPGGFFDNFKNGEAEKGLRILLVNQIIFDDSTMAGVTTIQDGYYNIFLGVGAFNEINVHHEIWHAMEYTITYKKPEAFDSWASTNPTGFIYKEDYSSYDPWPNINDETEWFVREYSKINEMEDRATVIEALFLYDNDWWNEHPYIKRKLKYLLDISEPVFGEVYFQK